MSDIRQDNYAEPAPVVPAARFQQVGRVIAQALAPHGRPLRGLMSTPKSPQFQGRFGRMFRSLPAATYGNTDADSRAALIQLGSSMTSSLDLPKDGFDGEESGIPALYTYFGQFIDHDITFDPMTTLMQNADPDALTDFRTPALDLDNVYGRGPSDQPYMYEGSGRKFLLGKPMANGAPDLPRSSGDPARAIIGDPRNDENSIVSQFQGLMLRFHNRVADDNPTLDFASLQRVVRWHYQWVVVHDFLAKIVQADVLAALTDGHGHYDRSKLAFYHWKNEPFMPVEFAAAAYRLGHSMVRPGYRMNDGDDTLVPIFAVPPGTAGAPIGGLSDSLAGFQAMAADRGIDWGRFIDIDKRAYGGDPDQVRPATPDMKKRLQFAYRLDTSLVMPLGTLPASVAGDTPRSLADRNLIRGYELGLPTGQDVARAMNAKHVLTDDEIVIGKAVDDPNPTSGDVRGTVANIPGLSMFKGKCPLWTYILAEAAFGATKSKFQVELPVTPAGTKVTTPQLGEVGGRIVAEVFLGMMFGDSDSFLSAAPQWTPTIGTSGSSFALRDIVSYALGK